MAAPDANASVRRAVKDGGWVAMAQAGSKGLVLVALVVLARVLPVDAFAEYAVFLAVWTILVPLLDCGMWLLVTRASSQEAGSGTLRFTRSADRARAPVWAIALAAAAAGALLGIWPYTGLLAVVAAIGQAEIDTASGELIGRRRFAAGSVLRLCPAVLGLAGAAALPLIGRNLEAAVVVFSVARAVPALLLLVAAWTTSRARSLSLREGLPFCLTSGLMMLYISSDLILLSVFGIAAAGVAVYGIAYRTVIGLQLVIPGAAALSLYPRIAAATAERSRLLVPVTAGISTAACAIVMAVLFTDLHAFFSIFGATYADSIGTVRPLLLVLLPIAVSNSYVSGLQARHHERSVLRLVIVVAAVNIAGNLALIPVLGIRGALIATSGAEWIAAFGALAIAARRSIAPSRDLAPSAALMIPAVLSFFSIPGPVVSLALVVWLLVAWELNAFEIRRGLQVLRRENRGMTVEPAAS